MNIPHMEKQTVYDALHKYASNIKSDECIVEVGSWFGAGSYALCQGAISGRKYNDIHLYDQWTARKTEIDKALKFGIKLKDNENLLSYVQKNLSEFNKALDINYYRSKIQSIKKFSGNKIGLYVDDASKRKDNFDHVMKIFKPHFSKGAIIILMDFFYYETRNDNGLRYQANYMTDNSEFEFVKRIPESFAAVYRYKA